MTVHTMKSTGLVLVFSAALAVSSCKGKQANKDVHSPTTADTVSAYDTSATVAPAPGAITDAQLTDATKDFPGVTATMSNGEVTLTGTIERDKLPRLMQSVQALNPAKVNNNLTIK